LQNNNGNQGHHINHQEVTNEIRLIESLLHTKDELIQSKNAIIQQLEQQIEDFKKMTSLVKIIVKSAQIIP
jgi:histidyl-tRNA synthetase